jgi:serine/threonine-protein kinase
VSAEKHQSASPGRSAGRYEFISQIATSPLGPLWAAHVTTGAEEGRIVGVRRIPKVEPVIGPFAEELAAAARIAMEVRHPRVAAVLDIVPSESEIAVVTEYVEGELLRSIQRRTGLKNEPFSDRIALRLGLDLCDAVSELTPQWQAAVSASGDPCARHMAEGAHGGLAADSLLIAGFGEPMLLDLGTSAMARRHPLIANHPDVLPYCAPEQLVGAPADERSDVFTIGVLLWEMLANRALFGSPKWARFGSSAEDVGVPAESSRAAAVRRKVLDATIARLDALVRVGDRIPTPVANVVARAIEREPAARYTSVADLGAALRELGAESFAEPAEVAEFLHTVAGTSLEARAAALSAITGRSQSGATVDPTRPTVAPRAKLPDDVAVQPFPDPGVPPHLDPRHISNAEGSGRKKPPLPPKRRKQSE